MVKPSLSLVGDWTSPRLLIRLMAAIDSPWELTERGLRSRETGDLCRLEMRGPDKSLAAMFLEGDSPTSPSLTDEIAAAITTHRSVLRILPLDAEGEQALIALVRGGSGLANAGAIALLCPQSGAAHAADRWLALAADIEVNPSADALSAIFVRPLVRAGNRWRSTGMGLLGLPDVALPGVLPDAVALDLITKTLARLRLALPPSEAPEVWTSAKHRATPGARPGHFIREDDHPPERLSFNPYGLYFLSLS